MDGFIISNFILFSPFPAEESPISSMSVFPWTFQGRRFQERGKDGDENGREEDRWGRARAGAGRWKMDG